MIAPHPDDECLGAEAALIFAPEQTDIYVLTDESHGNPQKSIQEEALIRKSQFEAEMALVCPRSWTWLDYEDTTLGKTPTAADTIDFSHYTKIFLPWDKSFHPDHRAAALICLGVIKRQNVTADCLMYEINPPFYQPTHYADITSVIETKKRLIRCHEDQAEQKKITVSLNRYRSAQMLSEPDCLFAESHLKYNFE